MRERTFDSCTSNLKTLGATHHSPLSLPPALVPSDETDLLQQRFRAPHKSEQPCLRLTALPVNRAYRSARHLSVKAKAKPEEEKKKDEESKKEKKEKNKKTEKEEKKEE